MKDIGPAVALRIGGWPVAATKAAKQRLVTAWASIRKGLSVTGRAGPSPSRGRPARRCRWSGAAGNDDARAVVHRAGPRQVSRHVLCDAPGRWHAAGLDPRPRHRAAPRGQSAKPGRKGRASRKAAARAAPARRRSAHRRSQRSAAPPRCSPQGAGRRRRRATGRRDRRTPPRPASPRRAAADPSAVGARRGRRQPTPPASPAGPSPRRTTGRSRRHRRRAALRGDGRRRSSCPRNRRCSPSGPGLQRAARRIVVGGRAAWRKPQSELEPRPLRAPGRGHFLDGRFRRLPRRRAARRPRRRRDLRGSTRAWPRSGL